MQTQAEILDESDIYEDVNRRLVRRDRERADTASYLAMFDHKLHATALSSAEMAAVASFLVLNVEEFAPLLAPHDLPLKVCSAVSVIRVRFIVTMSTAGVSALHSTSRGLQLMLK